MEKLTDLVKMASSGMPLMAKSIPMAMKLLPTALPLVSKLLPTVLTTSTTLMASISGNEKMMEGAGLIVEGLTTITERISKI
ncbi:MAG: hypothetical protein EF807_09120 [Candidatus Methanolliviera hydrocarbonicum]|uniref:Uncharacterized protein n=1 Tax=Candidatus Methanolliviera hydrocarbonicum TaxID=2491085 RepID=A0A520KU57_9EURY|nr:MAG: hypothetical protein EF807_09120 [Candidatus Methanolliviera hydrocarbonicum]